HKHKPRNRISTIFYRPDTFRQALIQVPLRGNDFPELAHKKPVTAETQMRPLLRLFCFLPVPVAQERIVCCIHSRLHTQQG
ncbi:MAG: hypothetical protein ACOC2H_03315, partial [Spirochaetota bacterium]